MWVFKEAGCFLDTPSLLRYTDFGHEKYAKTFATTKRLREPDRFFVSVWNRFEQRFFVAHVSSLSIE